MHVQLTNLDSVIGFWLLVFTVGVIGGFVLIFGTHRGKILVPIGVRNVNWCYLQLLEPCLHSELWAG